MVGLSDEAGAGASVGLAAKARHAPTALEVTRVDEYIQNTLWGVQQDVPFPISLQDHATMGVRASLFWVPTPVSVTASRSCFHPRLMQESHGGITQQPPPVT